MKIEHIALYVNDLEKCRDFFVKYFDGKSNGGYHNKTTDFRSYFITFEDGSRLELMTKPGVRDEGKNLLRTGFVHIAFSTGSKEKVDALTERLKNDGFKVISGPRTTGDGYYESCILGIEDNQIEITV
ncbi:MAG: VOC family protein [Treponema sp.]|nr:VOC family protein [Treponema sp.]